MSEKNPFVSNVTGPYYRNSIGTLVWTPPPKLPSTLRRSVFKRQPSADIAIHKEGVGEGVGEGPSLLPRGFEQGVVQRNIGCGKAKRSVQLHLCCVGADLPPSNLEVSTEAFINDFLPQVVGVEGFRVALQGETRTRKQLESTIERYCQSPGNSLEKPGDTYITTEQI